MQDGLNEILERDGGGGFGTRQFDLESALKRFPIASKGGDFGPSQRFAGRGHQVYRISFLPLRFRRRVWALLRRINLDTSWFNEFSSYWGSVLLQRPMWGVQDFFFLRAYYRLFFQNLSVNDNASDEEHCAAFQDPRTIYFLLHQVYKESLLTEAAMWRKAVGYAGAWPQAVLEYGCATAPLTTSLFEFFPRKARALDIYLADLESFAFQFGAFKFRNADNVHPIVLQLENSLQLDADIMVDMIFCLTVYEHMNAPLETTRRFHQNLRPGGLLIFDYIKSEASGLDTDVGRRERGAVLHFIAKNFDIREGDVGEEAPTQLIVAQKK